MATVRTTLTLDTHEIDIQIKRITVFGGRAEQYLSQVLERCMRLDLWPLWIKQISMHDHTLEQLRKLGHPYSTRYGKDSFVHPDDVVHIQDGNLLGRSLIQAAGNGWQLVNDSPEYVDLRYGTAHMRMRDPGGKAVELAIPLIKYRFKNEVKNAIVEVVGR